MLFDSHFGYGRNIWLFLENKEHDDGRGLSLWRSHRRSCDGRPTPKGTGRLGAGVVAAARVMEARGYLVRVVVLRQDNESDSPVLLAWLSVLAGPRL